MNAEHLRDAGQEMEGLGAGMESLVRLFRVMFLCLRVLIVLIFVYLTFSGIFFVREHEEAMLFRFGGLVEKDGTAILTSGRWYWAFPYPIDRVKRIPAQRAVTLVSTQHWPVTSAHQLDPAEAPEELDPETDVLRPGQDGYLLTGDYNIMHMVWSITYRIADAKKYYLNYYDGTERGPARNTAGAQFKPRDVEASIRGILDEAALAEVGTWPVESVLVLSRAEAEDRGRESLAAAVRRRTIALLEDLDRKHNDLEHEAGKLGLGIEVQQVSLLEVQPPRSAQAAFREVVDAAQEHRTAIDEARAYQETVVTGAEGSATKIIAEAKAYRTRVVESVKADKAYFLKVLTEYEKNPRTMLVALYTDAIRDVLNQVEDKYVIHARPDGRQEIRLLLGPEPRTPGATQSE